LTIDDATRLNREILLRSMFPSMPAAAHMRFIELLEDVEAASGQLVFDVGEPPDSFLFLIEGRVVMEREGQRPWEFAPLAVVGVIDAILERPRTRNCRALAPSRFLSIRRNDWFDMLEDNGQIARAAIRNFATQLHGRWRELAPRLRRPSEPPPAPSGPNELETYDKILVLRRAAFLRSAGMQAIASLASIAEAIQLRPGQVLFEAGAHEENLYVVVRGQIELTAEGDFRLQQGAAELIGGPAALCRALPQYGARAVGDATVLRVSEQDFYDHAEEHPRLTRGTLAYLVSELEPLLQIDDSEEPPLKLEGSVIVSEAAP
jgi:CRP-like cAMP-binding protein